MIDLIEVEDIKEFLKEGLLTGKILCKATDLKAPGISNRLKRGTPFKTNEVSYLRLLYRPLFKKLYPEYFSLAERPVERVQSVEQI